MSDFKLSRQIAFAMLVATSLSHSNPASANCDKQSDSDRFNQTGDGLKDTSSGLIWKQCLLGQTFVENTCSGDAIELSWLDAEAKSKMVAIAANQNWRLPKLDELETLLDETCSATPLPSVFQFNTRGEIWTASPGFPVNDVAAIINLQDGKVWGVGKGVSRYIWLVSGDFDY